MTSEAEALTKWCPFARVPLQAFDRDPIYTTEHNVERFATRAVAVNRAESGNANAGALCIGSACMAWRWIPNTADESLIEAIRRHRSEHGSGLREAKDFVESTPSYRRKSPEPGEGYCGLAGSPQ